MICNHTWTQQAPLGAVLGAPSRTLQEQGESHSHKFCHDDAQRADAPLVWLVVGHGHGYAEAVGEVVEVGLLVVKGPATVVVVVVMLEKLGRQGRLDLPGGVLDLAEGVVHQGSVEAGCPREEVRDGCDDGLGV